MFTVIRVADEFAGVVNGSEDDDADCLGLDDTEGVEIVDNVEVDLPLRDLEGGGGIVLVVV